MLKLAKIVLFFIVMSQLAVQLISCQTTCAPRCLVVVRCSSVEDTAWATDGRRCYVFRNPCHLESENCSRRNRCLAPLVATTAAACRPLCPSICTMQWDPVCAEYNGVRRTFGNSCALAVHICQSGQTYQLLRRGVCN